MESGPFCRPRLGPAATVVALLRSSSRSRVRARSRDIRVLGQREAFLPDLFPRQTPRIRRRQFPHRFGPTIDKHLRSQDRCGATGAQITHDPWNGVQRVFSVLFTPGCGVCGAYGMVKALLGMQAALTVKMIPPKIRRNPMAEACPLP